MSQALTVDLNRDRLHDLAATGTYTTDEAFYVELVNHGEAVHIHLHLDDTLSDVARLEAGNHYVDKGATEIVRVDVDSADEPITGTLKVVTGYGAESTKVDVTIEPFVESNHVVQVDEELSKPKRRREPDQQEPSLSEQFATSAEGGTLPVVALGLVAIFLALAVGVLVDSTVVFIGVGVVIGGVLAAIVMQLR